MNQWPGTRNQETRGEGSKVLPRFRQVLAQASLRPMQAWPFHVPIPNGQTPMSGSTRVSSFHSPGLVPGTSRWICWNRAKSTRRCRHSRRTSRRLRRKEPPLEPRGARDVRNTTCVRLSCSPVKKPHPSIRHRRLPLFCGPVTNFSFMNNAVPTLFNHIPSLFDAQPSVQGSL